MERTVEDEKVHKWVYFSCMGDLVGFEWEAEPIKAVNCLPWGREDDARDSEWRY